jgi:hypothetical protein
MKDASMFLIASPLIFTLNERNLRKNKIEREHFNTKESLKIIIIR